MSVLTLIAVRSTPLSVDEVLAAVRDPAAGGLVVFIGMVREHDADRPVSGLNYTAHPSASERLQTVAEKVAARHPVLRLAAVHRDGDLAVGDLAVVVAVATAHRAEAFAAARELIDEIKAEVPIWKHQVFGDGSEEWVGSP